MKEHLADLIMREHQQVLLFPKLYGRVSETELACLDVDNLAVVLDIIGFPQDNSAVVDENDPQFFSRFLLKMRYYDFMFAIDTGEVKLTPEGLKFETEELESAVRLQAVRYIDWLDIQMSAYRSGEYNIGSTAFCLSERASNLMAQEGAESVSSAEEREYLEIWRNHKFDIN